MCVGRASFNILFNWTVLDRKCWRTSSFGFYFYFSIRVVCLSAFSSNAQQNLSRKFLDCFSGFSIFFGDFGHFLTFDDSRFWSFFSKSSYFFAFQRALFPEFLRFWTFSTFFLQISSWTFNLATGEKALLDSEKSDFPASLFYSQNGCGEFRLVRMEGILTKFAKNQTMTPEIEWYSQRIIKDISFFSFERKDSNFKSLRNERAVQLQKNWKSDETSKPHSILTNIELFVSSESDSDLGLV